jgi:Pectate lyase superfamily protein/Concanavalin A-like lectin/glucanases superfamily
MAQVDQVTVNPTAAPEAQLGFQIDPDLAPNVLVGGEMTDSQDAQAGFHYTTTTKYDQKGGEQFMGFDVRRFGAKGDGVTDDYAAVASAIAAASVAPFDKTVYFPPGNYNIASRPLVVNASDVHLIGSPDRSSSLTAAFGAGPLILLASPRRCFPTVRSLVPGPGAAMAPAFPTGEPNYIYASDAPTLDLDGLTEFTAECWVKASQPLPAQAVPVPISSMGIRLPSDAQDPACAFKITIEGDAVGFSLGGLSRNAPSTFTPGQVHHLALVLHAGTVTLYVDGQAHPETPVPNAGPVQQEAHEEVMIGAGMGNFPLGPPVFDAVGLDAIDSVRLSNTARYTENFSIPTVKFANDAQTLLLLNFDNVDSNFVVAETTPQPNHPTPAYLSSPFAQPDANGIFQIANVGVQNLQINCSRGSSGIYGRDTIASNWQNISILFPRQGMVMSDVFFSFLSRIAIGGTLSTRRFGVAITGGEVLTAQHINADGGRFCIALRGDAGGAFANLFLAPRAETVASLLCKGADVSIHGCEVDDEGTATTAEANFMVGPDAGGVTSLSVLGGELASSTARPHLLVDTGTAGAAAIRVSLVGTTCFGQQVPELVSFVNPNPAPGLVSMIGVVNADNRPVTTPASQTQTLGGVDPVAYL